MGKQVKIVVSTPAKTQPAGMGDNEGRPADSPLSQGAPMPAPSQTEAVTALGPTQQDTYKEPSGGTTPPPASAATTGPKIASPSVDYDKNQGSRVTAAKAAAGANLYQDQQQQLQDKAGA